MKTEPTQMVRIRRPQWEALERMLFLQFVDSMAAHLRQHFPARLASTPESELALRVKEAIGTARGFGLESERDCCRFLNFAGEYGWTFLDDPATAWIRGILADSRGGLPSSRLDRAVSIALRRHEVMRRNEELRKQLAGPPAPRSPWKNGQPEDREESFWDEDPLLEDMPILAGGSA